MSNFEQYQALIDEFGKSLGFEQVHLVDDVIFSLDIDQQYELNYLYGEDTNRVLVVSYFTPPEQQAAAERNIDLLQANVGLSGEYIIKYGLVKKVNKVAFSLELLLDSYIDVVQLTIATQSLMEITEYWIKQFQLSDEQVNRGAEPALETGLKV